MDKEDFYNFSEQTWVVALGGNAIARENDLFSRGAIQDAVNAVTKACSDNDGMSLVLTHGNGPQIGELEKKYKRESPNKVPSYYQMVRETQMQIGQRIVDAIDDALDIRNGLIHNTNVIVDRNDLSFKKPVKGIGQWVKDKSELLNQGVPESHIVRDPAGKKGFREAVPSPQPLEIANVEELKSLVSPENVLVCGGGGGLPVVSLNGEFFSPVKEKVVIDKDLTAALIADRIKADVFVILTNIPGYFSGFGTKNQKLVPFMSSGEARRLAILNQNGNGSMNPKLLAMAQFVEKDRDRWGVITDIDTFAILPEARNSGDMGKFFSRVTLVTAGATSSASF